MGSKCFLAVVRISPSPSARERPRFWVDFGAICADLQRDNRDLTTFTDGRNMGRSPKPADALKLTGSWREVQRRKSEPPKEDGVPECPQWLDDVGRRAWHDWVPRIVAMRVLSLADRDALALMCDTWSRYLEARARLAEEGEVIRVEGGDGRVTVKRNPWSAVLAEHGDRLRRSMSEFGLTPVGRARVGAAKEAAKDAKEIDIFTRRA